VCLKQPPESNSIFVAQLCIVNVDMVAIEVVTDGSVAFFERTYSHGRLDADLAVAVVSLNIVSIASIDPIVVARHGHGVANAIPFPVEGGSRTLRRMLFVFCNMPYFIFVRLITPELP
jgi:hypothetical protein